MHFPRSYKWRGVHLRFKPTLPCANHVEDMSKLLGMSVASGDALKSIIVVLYPSRVSSLSRSAEAVLTTSTDVVSTSLN